MLRSAGMHVTAAPSHEFYVCEPEPTATATAEARDGELRAAVRLDQPRD